MLVCGVESNRQNFIAMKYNSFLIDESTVLNDRFELNPEQFKCNKLYDVLFTYLLVA